MQNPYASFVFTIDVRNRKQLADVIKELKKLKNINKVMRTDWIMTKEYIHTEKAPSAIGAYSQAVKYGGYDLFIRTNSFRSRKMTLVSDDIDMQIKQVFINLTYVLEASGLL